METFLIVMAGFVTILAPFLIIALVEHIEKK